MSRNLLHKQIAGFAAAPGSEKKKGSEDTAAEEAAEKESTEAAPSERALANLCQMLFNTNEFLYVQ